MFRFRLEKVLRYRRRLVEEQARRLREAETKHRHLVRRREALQEEARHLAASADLAVSVDVKQRQRLGEYTRWLQLEAERLLDPIAAAFAEVDREREALVEEHRQQEVLEKLKESRRREWLVEESRQERKRMDDVAGRPVAVE